MTEDEAREALREMRAEPPGVIAVLDALEKCKHALINAQRFHKAATARDLERALREHIISPQKALEQLQALELDHAAETKLA